MTTIMVIMGRQQPFTLVYDPEVNEHLRAIEAKYHSYEDRVSGGCEGTLECLFEGEHTGAGGNYQKR